MLKWYKIEFEHIGKGNKNSVETIQITYPGREANFDLFPMEPIAIKVQDLAEVDTVDITENSDSPDENGAHYYTVTIPNCKHIGSIKISDL